MGKVQSFRDALTDAANLAGMSSGEFKTESEFIEKIVGDVLNKLHGMSSSHTTGLFGIDSCASKVRSRFEGIFVANFRQELKTGSMADLQRSFLSQLLGQEILNMGSLVFEILL
ncbi:hypothetical protein OIU79_031140 [Salix purpurea]|uniref:TIR domain-containing protein n=1 Tax=Salix purpurea TaxID=77065 RepID=A0A9Q0ZS43_SALPP|nr:hypothetical protein OIU79_031140 [Salix purpurea]